MAKYIENGDNKPTTKVIPKSASFCSTRALKKCQKVQTYPYEIYKQMSTSTIPANFHASFIVHIWNEN